MQNLKISELYILKLLQGLPEPIDIRMTIQELKYIVEIIPKKKPKNTEIIMEESAKIIVLGKVSAITFDTFLPLF